MGTADAQQAVTIRQSDTDVLQFALGESPLDGTPDVYSACPESDDRGLMGVSGRGQVCRPLPLRRPAHRQTVSTTKNRFDQGRPIQDSTAD